MVNVLCVGFGKMGQWTYNCLKKVPAIDHIFVVEPKGDLPPSSDKTTFQQDFEYLPKIDYAFVITPTVTHYDVLKKVLQLGVKKIFIEKPALKTEEEFQAIKPLVKDAKIAVGYILRQSKALSDLKEMITREEQNGYTLKKCHVAYMKDKTNDPRSKNDFGIYEEVYHVWDVLFNYLNLKDKAGGITLKRRNIEADKTRPERHIAENIHYTVLCNGHETDISIVSSFKNKSRKRIFSFVMEQPEKAVKKLVLSFDGADGLDRVKTFEGDKLIEEHTYPANEKLMNQIKALCHYFETGEQSNLHFFENSLLLQDIYKFTTAKDKPVFVRPSSKKNNRLPDVMHHKQASRS